MFGGLDLESAGVHRNLTRTAHLLQGLESRSLESQFALEVLGDLSKRIRQATGGIAAAEMRKGRGDEDTDRKVVASAGWFVGRTPPSVPNKKMGRLPL
jgi:hypothetical protein